MPWPDVRVAMSRSPQRPKSITRAAPIIETMPHVIEPATSARAKCRGCDLKIDKGELRFGERQPNAFG